MQINWTSIGGKYNGTEAQRERIQREIDGMEWHPSTDTMPMMQGMAIQTIVREVMHGGKCVTQVSYNSGLGPNFFLGVEKLYKNGRARVYALYDGVTTKPLRTDFWPNEDTA